MVSKLQVRLSLDFPMLATLISQILQKIAFVAPGGGSLRPWLHRLRGVRLGPNVWLGHLVYLDALHPADITVGENSTIGMRTSIFTHFYWGPRRPKSDGRVTIGKDVFVGPHCVILPNVKIGDGAVIRAGTVVSRHVPARAFWGVPSAGALGIATVSLTSGHSYDEFTRGLRMRSEP